MEGGGRVVSLLSPEYCLSSGKGSGVCSTSCARGCLHCRSLGFADTATNVNYHPLSTPSCASLACDALGEQGSLSASALAPHPVASLFFPQAGRTVREDVVSRLCLLFPPMLG